MKTCPGCPQNGPQPDTAFGIDRSVSTGLRSRCKACCAKAKREYLKRTDPAYRTYEERKAEIERKRQEKAELHELRMRFYNKDVNVDSDAADWKLFMGACNWKSRPWNVRNRAGVV